VKRPLLKRVYIGGYPWSFLLAVGATHEQIVRRLKREAAGDPHTCTEKCWTCGEGDDVNRKRLELIPGETGVVIFLHCRELIMILRSALLKPRPIGTIAHEALHVTRDIMEAIGIPMSETSHEAWCYLLEDIVVQVVAILGAHRADGSKIRRRK
jgi:hypothetical protein